MLASMLALGLISGTSADGVDAALIETDGVAVRERGPALTLPYPEHVRAALLATMADPARAEHDPLPELDAAVTAANLGAVRALLRQAGEPAVSVIGMHGQTILHRPERRFTRQLGSGAALHAALGLPVVDHFRHADVAAGGQGAPFVPLYHAALLRDAEKPVAVLNLGGVGNATFVGDEDDLLAFDTGPASAMIDDWMARHTGEAMDEGGETAARGTVDRDALERLLDNPYFGRRPPKSLDRNDFSSAPVEGLSVADGAATLTAFTAHTVARAREHFPSAPLRWFVTGGGRHNATLMRMLAELLAAPVGSVDTLGWDGDALEAQAFGFLAVRALAGLPLSLPGTTGVPAPMQGGIIIR